VVGRLDELRTQLSKPRQRPVRPHSRGRTGHADTDCTRMTIDRTGAARPFRRAPRGSATLLATLSVLLLAAACDRGGRDAAWGTPAAEAAPTHVDSVFPIEEEIRRFRATLPDSAARLEGGATSMDELVDRFIAGLERSDAAALQALALTPAEFGYLYYPHTHFTRRPYEMSPALVWFQLENYGSKGLNRALSRYGGEPLRSTGYRCTDEVRVESENRIHGGCVVQRVASDGSAMTLSLFGAILERDGHFKFISLANGL
jgi:hypothetical protein